VGPPRPPAQRNNTPLVLGVLGAVAAIVLVVVLVAGGSDSDDDPGGAGAASSLPGGGEAPTLPGAGAPTGGGEQPDTADPAYTGGQALAQQFLDLVNGGDAEAAVAMLCQVGDIHEDEQAIRDVAGDAALQIDPDTAEIVSQGIVYSVDLTGTVHGESADAHVAAAARDDCIVNFRA
jgi:hypothetical protein